MIDLRHAFGFSREPFPQDVALDQLFGRPGLDALLDRFHYTIELAMVGVITGQVGSGKSTSLRCAASRLHPSAFRLLAVLASAGTYMELLRSIAAAAGLQHRVTSTVTLTTTIRDHLTDIRAKKQTPLLIIDEAHLMRLDVFAQLHTLTQFQFDSQSLMPVVLCGQDALIDKLLYHTSRPFASRVVARSHLEPLQLSQMCDYLRHHLCVAGGRPELFDEQALTAIHQSSGGALRRANNIARGALMAAAAEQAAVVTAEHARLAVTEIL